MDQPPATTAAKRPPRWGLVLAALVLGLGMGSGFIWWQTSRKADSPRPHPTDSYEEEFPATAGTDAARRHMEELAESLRRYRAEFGDNVRWPLMLEDLKPLGLIAADFSFMGELSRRLLTWAPDVPAGYDPSRWAICCDVQMGRRHDRRRGTMRAPLAAVVITGDGNVRVLTGDEVHSIGGMTFDVAAR